MELYVKAGKIVNKKGQEIPEDNSGIISIVEDGKPRRFVKEKLIQHLLKGNKVINPPKIRTKIRTSFTTEERITGQDKKVKTWTKRNERKKRTDFTREGENIKAIKDGVTYGPYLSINECTRELGLGKSTISRIFAGKPNNTGYEFIKL